MPEYALDLLNFCASEMMLCEKPLEPECKNYFALKEEEILD